MPPRASTRVRVHAAVLALAADAGLAGLTMEGIAARAGAGKQTLYRTWPTPAAILFDALLARSTDAHGQVVVPDTGRPAQDLVVLMTQTVAELQDPANERLLRAVIAELQSDPDLGAQVLDHLLGPQLMAVADRLRAAGLSDAVDGAELLLGPVLHRWLLRTRPFTADWLTAHVGRVLRALETT